MKTLDTRKLRGKWVIYLHSIDSIVIAEIGKRFTHWYAPGHEKKGQHYWRICNNDVEILDGDIILGKL